VPVRRPRQIFFALLAWACALAGGLSPVYGAEGFAGLYRDPDISATHVAFVHGDAVWVARRDGGLARKVTREPAAYRFPRFSPDGRTLAYVRGDLGLLPYGDIYTVPVEGGEPTRVTHHPDAEILCDWAGPDQLLFFGQGESPVFRRHELFTVPARGGLPEKLPVGPGAFGALSPDGAWLAYVLHYQDIGLEWKRYQGGAAPDLWLFHLPTHSARRITDWPGTDTLPMWHAGRLYYLSDQGASGRRNLWSYDPRSGEHRQLTRLRDFDARWPAIGPGRQGNGEIIFEQGSDLRLLDLRTGELATLDIRVPEIPPAREVDAGAFLSAEGWEISPTGDAAVVEARGDLWIVPAAGPARNLTRSDGTADRGPAWSPDGRWIAWFSDATGEYELTVAPADGSAPARTLTHLGPGFRRDLAWSPDSRLLAFADHTGALYVQALAGGPTRRLDQDPYGFRPGFAWSPDSAWLAYTKTGPNFLAAIWLYDLRAGAAHQVTSGAFDDSSPTFDRQGKYFYFASTRDFGQTTFGLPRPGDLDRPFVNAATQVLLAVPLRGKAGGPAGIDLAGFEQRAVRLPIAPGGRWSYFYLGTDPRGRLVYSYFDAAGESSIRLFDPASGTEETVTTETEDFRISADGRRLLLRRGREMAIVEVAPGQGLSHPLSTADLAVQVDPRHEWKQMFTDLWRLARDFFYDPGMHGVDWDGMRRRYAPLVARCGSRRDLGYVLNELLGELNVSHTEVSGGDITAGPRFAPGRLGTTFHLEGDPGSQAGMLGADFVLRDGAYQIAHIYRGMPEIDLPGPLAAVDVREGDFLLAVNGRPLDTGQDPWAAFAGLAGREIELTVSAKPVPGVEARRVKVTPGASEADLRYLEWIRANRELAAERSGGRIGYIYLPFTSIPAQSDFYRQLYGQLHLDALILDARWNGGGGGGTAAPRDTAAGAGALRLRARRRGPPGAAARAPRAQGAADQRPHRVGRRRPGAGLPHPRPGQARRQPHLGRADRQPGQPAADRRRAGAHPGQRRLRAQRDLAGGGIGRRARYRRGRGSHRRGAREGPPARSRDRAPPQGASPPPPAARTAGLSRPLRRGGLTGSLAVPPCGEYNTGSRVGQ
jgi:tricorn protease